MQSHLERIASFLEPLAPVWDRFSSVVFSARNADSLTIGAPVAFAVTIAEYLIPWTEKYLFGDIRTVWFLLVLIAVDTVLGLYLAWKRKQLKSVRFARVFGKFLTYMGMLIAAFAVTEMGGAGPDSLLFQGMRWMIVSFIAIREFLSIAEKSTALGYGPPKWLLQRLQDYIDSGPASLQQGAGQKKEDPQSPPKP